MEATLAQPDAELVLRQDPNGIAPERALVFETVVPIARFAQVAARVGLEVISEVDLEDDYALPDDLIAEHADQANPMLYATMPTLAAFNSMLRLRRAYERNEAYGEGEAPWWQLFDMLAELRPWGPEDRFSAESRAELVDRLPFDDTEEVRLELEIWPSANGERRARWRRETEARVNGLGGRVVSQSSIEEEGFVYDAMLIGLSAGTVRDMLDNPSAPEGLAMLDGIQFVLPQSIGQSIPADTDVEGEAGHGAVEALDEDAPARAVLLDGTPVAAHESLDGGVVIEDVHDLVPMSLVEQRRHATAMASLILRGDLEGDGAPVSDTRLVSIPVLIDSEGGAFSPDDRLFVDVLHTALARAFLGDDPLAPDAFVVNLSIGVRGAHFSGRMSALARLLDWWAATEGLLFVVSSGNVARDLRLAQTRLGEFEDAELDERRRRLSEALIEDRHRRTLLAPSEALNVLTVGAASVDFAPAVRGAPAGEVAIQGEAEVCPALSSAVGLGPFRAVKPDVIAAGGRHEVRAVPMRDDLSLRVVEETARTGLVVASARGGRARTRGTSCAAAVATRAILNAAAALTVENGPFAGQELPRLDLALLTRALAIGASHWPETASALFEAEKLRVGAHGSRAREEVVRHYGHGFLDAVRMQEAPILGTTLIGLGSVRKDQGAIFDMPLPPSLSGERAHRSMRVSLVWFSPVEPSRARYRLAALDAIAADRGEIADEDEDKGWLIDMKSGDLDARMIRHGTVWSRRLIHRRVSVPEYDEDEILPIRVQCRDSSGGGLNPDEDIRFAIAVTLELAAEAAYDIHEEIEQRLRVRLRAGEDAELIG